MGEIIEMNESDVMREKLTTLGRTTVTKYVKQQGTVHQLLHQ